MSGRGGQEGGYLEDLGGFLTRDMDDRVVPDVINDVFYLKDYTLKISCLYLNWKCVRKRVSRRRVFGGY